MIGVTGRRPQRLLGLSVEVLHPIVRLRNELCQRLLGVLLIGLNAAISFGASSARAAKQNEFSKQLRRTIRASVAIPRSHRTTAPWKLCSVRNNSTVATTIGSR